jgi:hypothetical protein
MHAASIMGIGATTCGTPQLNAVIRYSTLDLL